MVIVHDLHLHRFTPDLDGRDWKALLQGTDGILLRGGKGRRIRHNGFPVGGRWCQYAGAQEAAVTYDSGEEKLSID